MLAAVASCVDFDSITGGEPASDAAPGIDGEPSDVTSVDASLSDGGSADADAGETCDADLTSDDNNCGRCGRTCFGGPCNSGICGPVKIFSGANNFAYSGGLVYFTRNYGSGDGGGVSSYAPTTGQILNLVENQVSPHAIAIEPPYMVWSANDQHIYRAFLDGGAVTQLAALSAGQNNIPCIAVSATDVFWVNANALEVDHTSLDAGGAPARFDALSNIAAGCVRGDEKNLVVVSQGQEVVDVVLASNATIPVPDNHPIEALSFAGDIAYFVDGTSIYRMVPGSMPRTLVFAETSDSDASINTVAGDDHGVYWRTEQPDGSITLYGCSDTSCSAPPQTLSTVPKITMSATAMIVTPDSIYINGSLGATGPAVIRIAR
jgi:hypothetical protein